MNILIIGAPGSGKGTMSEKIAENYKVLHISTGDMLRAAIKQQTKVGLEAQKYVEAGKLVPDEVVNALIKEKLTSGEMVNGFLMDGFPRNLEQVNSFEAMLNDLGLKIDCVLNLEIKEEELAKRITGRRICNNCKSIYHIESKKPQIEGICDVCKGELIQRKDDTLESLEVRLATYHEQTQPILSYYKNLNLLKNIDASQKADLVFNSIKEALKG